MHGMNRRPHCEKTRSNSLWGYACLVLFSLCLLFSGPAHVVLHGLEGGCHVAHGEASSEHLGHAHLGGDVELSAQSHDGGGEKSDQVGVKSHSRHGEDCVHCMQSGGQAHSVAFSTAVAQGGALSGLALDHQVFTEAHLGSPSPRGPPAVA